MAPNDSFHHTMPEPLSSLNNCLLCDGPVALSHPGLEGYVQGKRFDIHTCESCGTSFASPLEVDPSVYDFIYRNSQFVPGYDRYHGYAKVIKRKADPLKFLADAEEMYSGIRQALLGKAVNAGQGARILEVGSGLGYTTYSLFRAGFDVRGIDLSEAAVASANERFGPLFRCASLAELAVTEAGSYDIVFATEVLEHVEDPALFLGEMACLLKPGGSIIITTPRKHREFASVWDTDLPPVHLWWFTAGGISALAEKTRLHCDFVDTSKHRSTWLTPYTPPPPEVIKQSFVSSDMKLLAKKTLRKSITRHLPAAVSGAILFCLALARSVSGGKRRGVSRTIVAVLSAKNANN